MKIRGRQMVAHEHFCSSCYGKHTNGMASGWWRCLKKQCTRGNAAPCRKHGELTAPDGTPEGTGR